MNEERIERGKPALDTGAICEAIARHYGLKVDRLIFVPVGEVANSYVAESADGARHFVKVLGGRQGSQERIRRLDFTLRLMWQLHAGGWLTNLPHPIHAGDGALSVDWNGLRLILFDYIAGRTLENEWPYSPEIRAAIARSMGRLHRSTGHLDLAGAEIERFDLPFANGLRRGLDALEGITDHDTRGRWRLAELLLPHREQILGYLGRLVELQARARAMPRDMVICHSDMIPHNLIVTGEGRLYILDWDEARLAPPEYDLFLLYSREHFLTTLEQYEAEYRPARLDGDLFAFYFYRRNLEDLTDWLVRILYEDRGDEQDARDCQGIIDDCMSWWPYAEETVASVKRQLDTHISRSSKEHRR